MIEKSQLILAFKYAPYYLKGFNEYHFKKHFGILNPKEMMFIITYRCNAKCIMCNIWKLPKKKELSLRQIEQTLSDKLFRSIQIINITGGEPTLREDITQIVQALIEAMPELKKITLTTNGLDTNRVVKCCTDIGEICNDNGIDFLVEVSLDGIGIIHDKVRNIPDAFKKVKETVFQIKKISNKYNFRFGINTVLSPINLRNATNFYEWCKRQKINVFFTVASIAENYYSNIDEKNLEIKNEDKKYLINFLQKLVEEKSTLNFLAYYYHDLIMMIKYGRQRTTPCVFSQDAFILDAYGDIYYCMYGQKIGNCLIRSCSDIYFDPKNLAHRKEIIENKCSTCFINCFSSIALGKELIKYIKFLLIK